MEGYKGSFADKPFPDSVLHKAEDRLSIYLVAWLPASPSPCIGDALDLLHYWYPRKGKHAYIPIVLCYLLLFPSQPTSRRITFSDSKTYAAEEVTTAAIENNSAHQPQTVLPADHTPNGRDLPLLLFI